MSILSGSILSVGKNFVIDRLQTTGAGDLNIPSTKIYETGNWETVANIYDIPDLSFSLESYDMSCEIEALLLNRDPTTITNHEEFDFNDSVPIDIISPYKSRKNQYDIIRGVIAPYLTLEKVTYQFGVNDASSFQGSLRGDSLYYTPGTPFYEEKSYTGPGSYSFAHTSILYDDGTNDNYAYSVCLRDTGSSAYLRLFLGEDYTNTSAGFVLTGDDLSATYDTVCVTYGSLDGATYPQNVHQGISVKPAAVKGRKVDIYLGNTDATPTFTRLRGVQSAQVNRSVTLQNTQEFGNDHYVSSDYDVPDVSGSITVEPNDPTTMWNQIADIAGVSRNQTVGPLSSNPVPMEIRISNPDTGSVIKTVYVPTARFTVPGSQAKANQHLQLTYNYIDDSGVLKTYNGTRS